MASQSKNFDRSKVKTFADAQKGRKMPWTYDGVLAVCEAAGKLVNPATGRCQSLFEDEETEDPSLKFDEKDGVLLAYDHRYPDVPFTDLLDKLDELREEYGEGTPNGNGAPKKEPYKPLSDAEIRARERALSGSPALAALKERGISHETACEWKLGAGKAKILDPVLGGPANAGRGEYIRLSALSIRDGEQVGVQGVNPDPSNKKYKVIARGERELTPDPQTVKGTVFVAESLTDAMSLTEMGFTSIAAPSATTWKAHYAAQFAGGDITQVCFLYDWDAEGRKGTKKAAPKVAKFVDDVRVLDISDGLPLNEGDKGFDLNDLLMEVGPDAAREHIERLVEETEPYAKPDGDDEPEEENYFSYSDLGNAERLAAQEAGSMMYVATHNDWYRYLRRKGVWKKAEMLEQDSAYTRMVKNMIHEAAEMDNSKARDALLNHVRRSESANSKGGCLSFARSRKQLAVHWSQLDAHPNRLNCQNGILDLESFELHKHDPSEYHTKITRGAFIEDAYSKEWEQFLVRAIPDEAVRAFLQRAIGMALIGEYSEYLILPYGPTRTSKSAFLDAVRITLGDYAGTINPELLERKTWGLSNGDLSELADLYGKRFVSTTETEEDKPLAEQMVQRFTGEGTIKAKFMGQNMFEFQNTSSFWLASNNRPQVNQDADGAIWTRVKVVDFDQFIPAEERVRKYGEHLAEQHSDAILTWAVEGLADYIEGGLQPPEAVELATQKWQQEEDSIRSWANDRLRSDPTGKKAVSLDRCREDYSEYCESNALRQKDDASLVKVLRGLSTEDKAQRRRATDGKQTRKWAGVYFHEV